MSREPTTLPCRGLEGRTLNSWLTPQAVRIRDQRHRRAPQQAGRAIAPSPNRACCPGAKAGRSPWSRSSADSIFRESAAIFSRASAWRPTTGFRQPSFFRGDSSFNPHQFFARCRSPLPPPRRRLSPELSPGHHPHSAIVIPRKTSHQYTTPRKKIVNWRKPSD
jgi:hypothetical protein